MITTLTVIVVIVVVIVVSVIVVRCLWSLVRRSSFVIRGPIPVVRRPSPVVRPPSSVLRRLLSVFCRRPRILRRASSVVLIIVCVLAIAILPITHNSVPISADRLLPNLSHVPFVVRRHSPSAVFRCPASSFVPCRPLSVRQSPVCLWLVERLLSV